MITENRALSAKERTLLDWLVNNGSPEAIHYLPQLSEVRVVGRCKCGCPSIDLGIAGASAATSGPSQIIADFLGETPDGLRVGVILHAREGKLSELEVYGLSGDEGSFTLPLLESLKPF